jgi:predicted transcriptional regulator of viral defense system
MPRRSRFSNVHDSLVAHFSSESQKVYSKSQLTDLLANKGDEWDLHDAKPSDFIAYLTKHTDLKVLKLKSEKYRKEITRYSWGRSSALALAASIHHRAYFSHGTAMMLHKLTPEPKLRTIYVNIEQSEKRRAPGLLTQEGINRAFSANQRQSNLIYTCNRTPLVVIAGKNTNRLSVDKISGPASEILLATSIERTLIDIAVRPSYSGGLEHILYAYRAAKQRVSVEKLTDILRELDYMYPYHQSIGFLMDKAGYPAASLEALRAFGLEFDFHLGHRLIEPIFSKEWRVHYPKALA